MGWVSGQEAQMVESMDSVLVGKTLTEEVFRKFFHPEFPEPESVYVTKWKQDKYSRGSYTFISKESSSQDIEHLCQPIYSDPGQEKPVMMFAGESCHPNFFSTVHGAFLSGKKASSYLFDPESLTT
jgi:monoamine oxidase